MTWDLPEELQFCAYIGQQEAFHPTDATPLHAPAETEWRVWWEMLPTYTFGARFDAARRQTPETAPRELLQRVDPRDYSRFDPPDFTRMRNMPALQQLCRSYWPKFHSEWGSAGGNKMRMVTKLHTQLRKIPIDRLVYECRRAANKPIVDPFYLQVDFVIWPEDYRHEISSRHLVLGVQYLEPVQVDALRTLIKTYIAKPI